MSESLSWLSSSVSLEATDAEAAAEAEAEEEESSERRGVLLLSSVWSVVLLRLEVTRRFWSKNKRETAEK